MRRPRLHSPIKPVISRNLVAMTRLHFFRNLRTAIMLLITCAVVAAGGTLWWANSTGLPETWRQMIEKEIQAKSGLTVSIASLGYHPLHGGLVATEIRFFSDATRTRQIARLERVALDFDKSRLARQEFKLTDFELQDGRLDLPVDPDDPKSEILEAIHVNATIAMRSGRLLEVRDASGQIEGIEVALSARLLGYREPIGTAEANDPNHKARMDLVKRCLDQIRAWKFDEVDRPKVLVSLDGDLADHSSLHGHLNFNATNIGKNGHILKKVNAEADWTGSLLTVTSLTANDRRGDLDARLDYDLNGREGRFGVTSTLDLPRLLHAWVGVDEIHDLSFGGEQKVETNGTFQLVDNDAPIVRLTGSVACKALMIRGVPFDSIESSFSWAAGNLYMRDIKALRRDGQLTGKMLLEGRDLRASIHTNFPFAVGRPFFVGQPFGHVLGDFVENDKTKVDATIDMSWDLEDQHSWVVSGHGKVEQCTYRGTPFILAETDLDLSHHALDFQNGTVIFDYRNYAMQRAHDGARSGTVHVKRVRYDPEASQVALTSVEGSFWPAPLVRMFARSVADNLENYRFHQPPQLQGSGVVDTNGNSKTDLRISVKTPAPADYEFLDKALVLEAPSANVRIQGAKVSVDNLAFRTFDGPIVGQITRLPGRDGSTLAGEFSWTRISFNDLAATYGFDPKGGGLLTGRLEFTSGADNVDHLSGRGLVGLENANLFSVPIFGPLSPILSGILGNRRAGFQQAKDAFCTFNIRDGILNTNDFRTGTASIVLTGDARINLSKRTMDMIMRMNARGLFGVITLPLRPFYGLFQFHGKGPLSDPEWHNVIFTSPPKDQEDALLHPPRATIIREE